MILAPVAAATGWSSLPVVDRIACGALLLMLRHACALAGGVRGRRAGRDARPRMRRCLRASPQTGRWR